MRRERTRARRFVLVFTAGALGVLLWQLATAAVATLLSEPDAAEAAAEPSAPHLRLIASSLPRTSAPAAASSLVTRWAAWTGDSVGAERAAAVLPSSSPPSVTPPPLPGAELAPDGLPATAMRCSRVGSELVCGDCRTDGDCPAGQGCVANRATRRFECMASECEEDVNCQAGSVCRPATTGESGRVIHRCVPEGVRDEGEACDVLPVSPGNACREGLRCVNQVCTTPCSVEGSPGCAPGFVCEEGLEGPGCFPDCEQRGCPEGQRCSRIQDHHSQCLVATQGDCRETPCAGGERCNMRMSRGRAVFWCARVCNPVLPEACGTGEVCGVGSPTVSTCFRRCDPNDLQACGAGWSCGTITEDMSVFGCSPDLQP